MTRSLNCVRSSASASITAFVRIDGQPFGLLANNPKHLGGAIDAEAGDKAARFMALCDAYRYSDRLAVRHSGLHGRAGSGKDRIGAPCLADVRDCGEHHRAVLHRRAAQGLRPRRAGDGRRRLPCARTLRSHGQPANSAAWASRARCGLASARRWRRLPIRIEREAFFRGWSRKFYENGKAINIASVLEIDQVIDPIETRHWISSGLRSAPKPPQRVDRKRPCVDTW